MRIVIKVKEHENVKRLMIYDCDDGVYLFLFDIEEDGGSYTDYWFESLDDALETAQEEYEVNKEYWIEIADPLEYCQHDWIIPARIPGRESGSPQWGKLEVLRDGKWIQVQ